MMQESVRDTEVEEKIYGLLSADPDKIWNVSSLSKAVGCSRAKIDRAFIALEVQDKITVEKLVGNSWIPRLKRGSNGSGQKPTGR